MTSWADTVAAFLGEDGWPAHRTDGDGTAQLDTRFAGTAGTWDCRVRVLEPFGQVVVESLLPLRVAPERTADIGDLVLDVNWRLLTGAFHLDRGTGTLVFRTTLLLQDGEPLTRGVVKGLLYGNVLTVERCYTELAAAVEGVRAPEESLIRLAL